MSTSEQEQEQEPPAAEEAGARRSGPARRAPVGMRQVATEAGVAMSSVSRVLSGHPDVSEEMRQRVLAAVERLDYMPDMLAQGLRRRSTMTVGFVVGDISNVLVSQFVKGAEHALRGAGYSMLLTNSLFDPELDRRHIELLSQRRVDGLLLLPVAETHAGMIAALEELTVPIVVLERELPATVAASRVLSDHHAGMCPAVDHLLDLGHRSIALISGQPVHPTRERAAALRSCFERRMLPPTFEVLQGSYSQEYGAAVTRQLLQRPDRPTAIIAAGNQITRGALQVIGEQRIELGRELSFVGCDDSTLARLHQPQIAILERDPLVLGRSAAELLLSRMSGQEGAPATVTHPTWFVPAPSCGTVSQPRRGGSLKR